MRKRFLIIMLTVFFFCCMNFILRFSNFRRFFEGQVNIQILFEVTGY
uniref:Uncharacterized protein n=1 Tax=Rhizophora mucronata TaxID=61149 RepID=A0A2P2LX92_RHIMU